ncbi:MAG: homoserine dehydrogenase [Gammaproteobacteria bacterium]
MKEVRVGLAGYGTVGKSVVTVLARNADVIARRSGIHLLVTHVGARRGAPDLAEQGIKVSQDVFEVARDPEVDVCIELMGGVTTARDWIEIALANGKPVVTANKALIAEAGSPLIAQARQVGVPLLFEAAVAGGIPILKALREGLSANQIEWVAGIINGTANYILTEMASGRTFSDVLLEAQAAGYAEADPTFDIEGIDAAHKLTILASMSFGVPLSYRDVYVEGITALQSEDLEYAHRLGYRVKHVALARQSEAGIEMRVHPTLIPCDALLANVNGVMNAVMVQGDAVGSSLYYGAGAGGMATASSVVADVIEVARHSGLAIEQTVPPLAFQDAKPIQMVSIDAVCSAFYLRFQVRDKPAVLAHITEMLGEDGVSIDAAIQKPVHEQTDLVSIVLLTQAVTEAVINRVIARIEALPEIGAPVTKLRVLSL